MSNETVEQIKKSIVNQTVTVVLAAVVTLVSSYFLLVSHGERISALEEHSVRKDVLVETLTPMKEATLRVDQRTEAINSKLDRLIERESTR